MATEAEILSKLNDLLDDISATLDAAGASKLVTLDRASSADSALMYLRQNGDERFRVGLVGGSDDLVIQHSPDGSPLTYADVLRVARDSGQVLFGDGSDAAPSISRDGDDNTGFYFPGPDQIAASTGGFVRLFIDDIGRVGIGTTAPATGARLHVSGGDANGILQVTGSTMGVRIGANASQAFVEGVDDTGVASFQPLFINGSALMLGIGGSELARLSGDGLSVGSSGGDYGVNWRGVFRRDYDGSTELGLINGATGPAAAMKQRFIGGTGNSFMVEALFDNSGAPYFEYLYGSAVSYVRWISGGTEFMRYVRATGCFGIGTQSPADKLHVNGRMRATGLSLTSLPTSSAGLSGGDVWNDGGTLKVV
jgi:hypothetical protein